MNGHARSVEIPHDVAMREHRDAAAEAVKAGVSTTDLVVGILTAVRAAYPGREDYALARSLAAQIDATLER